MSSLYQMNPVGPVVLSLRSFVSGGILQATNFNLHRHRCYTGCFDQWLSREAPTDIAALTICPVIISTDREIINFVDVLSARAGSCFLRFAPAVLQGA